jgi:hypothetical protein
MIPLHLPQSQHPLRRLLGPIAASQRAAASALQPFSKNVSAITSLIRPNSKLR